MELKFRASNLGFGQNGMIYFWVFYLLSVMSLSAKIYRLISANKIKTDMGLELGCCN